MLDRGNRNVDYMAHKTVSKVFVLLWETHADLEHVDDWDIFAPGLVAQ